MNSTTSAQAAENPIASNVTKPSLLAGCKSILAMFSPTEPPAESDSELPKQKPFRIHIILNTCKIIIPHPQSAEIFPKLKQDLDTENVKHFTIDNQWINKACIETVYLEELEESDDLPADPTPKPERQGTLDEAIQTQQTPGQDGSVMLQSAAQWSSATRCNNIDPNLKPSDGL